MKVIGTQYTCPEHPGDFGCCEYEEEVEYKIKEELWNIYFSKQDLENLKDLENTEGYRFTHFCGLEKEKDLSLIKVLHKVWLNGYDTAIEELQDQRDMYKGED